MLGGLGGSGGLRGLGRAGERRRIAERVSAVLAERGTVVLAERETVGWVPAQSAPAGSSDDRHGPDTAVRSPGGRRHAAAGRAVGRWRLDTGRRIAGLVGAAVLLVALVALAWVVLSRPDGQSVPVAAVGVPSAGATGGSGAAGGSSASGGSGGSGGSGHGAAPASTAVALLVVDVVGKVSHPGIYRVPQGSRVDDVLRAAGGALPGTDLTGLNLARKVADGEQVAVGVAAAAPTGDTASGGSVASGPVDLNSASVDQLDALPGVGPVLAQHIVDWRTAHGGFSSVQQLRQVSGIGDAKFADLEPLVIV